LRLEARRSKLAARSSPLMVLKNRAHYPALIIGTGIAGLTAAFTLARAGVEVLLVTKATDPGDCNTFWAQGGIIYQGPGDTRPSSGRRHHPAGAGLCNDEAVRFSPPRDPRWSRSCCSTRSTSHSRPTPDELDLTQEGAHSVSRIIHASDATGRAIEISLLNRISEEPNVTLATDSDGDDLLTTHTIRTDIQVRYRFDNECVGAYLLDNRHERGLHRLRRLHAPRDRWHRPDFSAHHEHRHSIGDGVVMAQPRRRARHERRVRPVPPHRASRRREPITF
jgi:hypothetical protein